MGATFRTYNPEPLFGPDYDRIRRFLLRLGDAGYGFGRWDWMITHGYLNPTGLPGIGLWEESGEMVALVTYDTMLKGDAYLLADPAHRTLLPEMIRHAETAFAKDGRVRILIRDGETQTQDLAAANGWFATGDHECTSVIPTQPECLSYSLPEGFGITDMKETFDLPKYGEVLWKGFNHEANGEGPFVFREEDRPKWTLEFLRPNVRPELKIAVTAPDGRFVSYCGMWFDPESESALVEPVATDPAYRRMGLGRAAVLEGVRRCGLLGAKRAFVGSSQQFYYAIGFRPYETCSWWVRGK